MNIQIETIDDLITSLESLLIASQEFRTRSKYKAAELRASDPVLQKSRKDEYNKQALNVYGSYRKYQKQGLSHAEALRHVREDHKLGYDAADITITQGRRIFKDLQRAQVRRDHAERGYTITQLSTMHGLSYNTVKSIVEQMTDCINAI